MNRPMDECPSCGEQLDYTSGEETMPSYLYCPSCLDWAYDEDGTKLAPLY